MSSAAAAGAGGVEAGTGDFPELVLALDGDLIGDLILHERRKSEDTTFTSPSKY